MRRTKPEGQCHHGRMHEVIDSTQVAQSLIGKTLGPSDQCVVTDRDVRTFAELTGDRQWIHLDLARAEEAGFPATMAHGFFTLSVIPRLMLDLYRFVNADSVLNYGLNRARFLAPVWVGSSLTMEATVLSVEDRSAGVLVSTHCAVTSDFGGQRALACVVELLTLVKFRN